MTNVLVEGYSRIPSYDLTVHDFKRLSSDMKINVRCCLSRDITSTDLSWADILVCVRGDNPLSLFLARKAKRSGKKVVLSLDDDLIEYHSHDTFMAKEWYFKPLKKIIDISDIILTTSSYLGEKYKTQYGIRYVLFDTTVDVSEIKEKHNNNDRVKLLYAAGKSHDLFFNKLIRPILNDLYKKYGDRIELTVIGPQIGKEGISLDINNVDKMPMANYNLYMKSHDFDIGLAPLFDFELGRSKYYNKYLEYTRNQICGIYSNVLPYTMVIEDEKNGFLVNNEPECWYDTICKLVEDEGLRNKCIQKATEHVLLEYSRENNIRKLIYGFPEFNSFNANHDNRVSCPLMYVRFILCELARRLIKIIAQL